jgi:hypothetical protein
MLSRPGEFFASWLHKLSPRHVIHGERGQENGDLHDVFGLTTLIGEEFELPNSIRNRFD